MRRRIRQATTASRASWNGLNSSSVRFPWIEGGGSDAGALDMAQYRWRYHKHREYLLTAAFRGARRPANCRPVEQHSGIPRTFTCRERHQRCYRYQRCAAEVQAKRILISASSNSGLEQRQSWYVRYKFQIQNPPSGCYADMVQLSGRTRARS